MAAKIIEIFDFINEEGMLPHHEVEFTQSTRRNRKRLSTGNLSESTSPGSTNPQNLFDDDFYHLRAFIDEINESSV